MKKVLFVVCVMISHYCFGNSIDTISNMAGLVSFVKTNMHGYEYVAYPSQVNNGTFYKVDIDNNGLTDLLISSEYCLLFAVLDSSDHYHVVRFADFKYKYKGAVKIDSITRLRLNVKQEGVRYKEDKWHELEVLYCRGFVEYNPMPSKHKIEKICFKHRPGWPTLDRYTIELNSNLKANLIQDSLNAKKYRVDTVFAFKTIKQEQLNNVINLLNYLSFSSMDNYYFHMGFDNPTGLLSIYYDNGQMKTIEDNGLSGTLGLEYLYQQMNNIFSEDNWQLQSVHSSKAMKY